MLGHAGIDVQFGIDASGCSRHRVDEIVPVHKDALLTPTVPSEPFSD